MNTFLGSLLHKDVCLIRFSLTLTMEMKIKASSILKGNYLVPFCNVCACVCLST